MKRQARLLILSIAYWTAIKSISYEWEYAEEIAQNTVVQLFSDTIQFDWFYPWRMRGADQVAGTGFFFKIPGQIDDDGYILTNYHIIHEACSIAAYIPSLGGQQLETTLVGACPDADIALLKLTNEAIELVESELSEFPYLQLDDSDELKRAMPVMALGYPLGQRYIKSTVGVIAGREYVNGQSFIHMTAPINPGNSGGPLLSMQVRVMGINTAGILEASNIGYIIPINHVKILIAELLTKPLVRKPSLGISCNASTDEHTRMLLNPIPAGMYINEVEKRSFAEQLGIEKGDMLYAINGYPIDKFCDVVVNWKTANKVSFGEFLTSRPAQTPIEFELYRNGTRKFVRGELAEPTLYPIRTIYPLLEPEETAYAIIGGMVVMSLRKNHLDEMQNNPVMGRYARRDAEVDGKLIVTALFPSSPLHKTGCLYPGAIINTINGRAVHSLKDFYEALALSKKTGRVAVATDDPIETAVSLQEIKDSESRLARDFMYTIPPETLALLQL